MMSAVRTAFAALCAGMFLAAPAVAQYANSTVQPVAVLQSAGAALRTEMQRDEKGPTACAIGGLIATNASGKLESYDLAVMVDRYGYSMVRMGKLVTETPPKPAKPGAPNAQPTEPYEAVVTGFKGFWFQLDDGSKIVPPEYAETDPPGYLLGHTSFADTVLLLRGLVVKNVLIKMDVRYEKQTERIIQFKTNFSDNDRKELQECLQVVEARAKPAAK